MANHPCGWLAIRHQLGCSLLLAEDATRAADSARLRTTSGFTRAATATEKTLLLALGRATSPAVVNLDTEVSGIPAVPTRTWPPLAP